ncbi:MAG: BMC domain-containing protein [Clostridia bacterium]|nr:BMC domain-containing protein [Clostridia bacterium]
MGKAVGIIEVFGLVAAFVACDAGCKAADVTVENFDKNKPANAETLPVPLIVCVKFRGEVDAVQAAIDAAKAAVEKVTGVVASYVIPSAAEDTEHMLKLTGMDKTK